MKILLFLPLAALSGCLLVGCSKKNDNQPTAPTTQTQSAVESPPAVKPPNQPEAQKSEQAVGKNEKRMPMTQEYVDKFSTAYAKKADKQLEAGAVNGWTIVMLGKDVIEGMGFNFEKTLLYHTIKVVPSGGVAERQFRPFFLLPASDPDESFSRKLISAKTQAYFKLLMGPAPAAPRLSLFEKPKYPEQSLVFLNAILLLHERYGTNTFNVSQTVAVFKELKATGKLAYQPPDDGRSRMEAGHLAVWNYDSKANHTWRIIADFMGNDVHADTFVQINRDVDEAEAKLFLKIIDLNALKKFFSDAKEYAANKTESATKAKAAVEERERRLKEMTSEMERFIN
ncbi:MAG: hypothetical protein ABMA26_23885 [Limisphaerales bacterium]